MAKSRHKFTGVCRRTTTSHSRERTPPKLIDTSLNTKTSEMNAIVIQCFACISANMGGFLAGTMLGWGTAVMPMLQNPNAARPLDNDQIGWIMSILGIGGLFGAVTTWLVLDVIGRKSTLILSMIPMIVSYAIMAVREDYAVLLIGRTIGGIGVGMFVSSGPLYIGEIAENRVRGAMGVLGVISTNFGCLFVYVISPHEIFSELNTVCASVAAALTILLLFIPESPYYYLVRGETENARSALVWLRRTSNVTAELHAMKTHVDEKKTQTPNAFDLITNRGNRRALTILLIVQTMQPFSGSLAIPAYAFILFKDSGYEMLPHQLITIMGFLMLFTSFAGVFMVDVLGRRPVLFLSTAVMSLCLVILATFYTLQSCDYDVSSVSWLPFAAVMGYVASHSGGLHSLPAILLSEYFPTNVKAKAAMIFSILLSLGGTVALKLFQLSADALGFGSTFLICCASLIFSTAVLFFIMPETRGCSLKKIECMHSREDPPAKEVTKVDGNFGI